MKLPLSENSNGFRYFNRTPHVCPEMADNACFLLNRVTPTGFFAREFFIYTTMHKDSLSRSENTSWLFCLYNLYSFCLFFFIVRRVFVLLRIYRVKQTIETKRVQGGLFRIAFPHSISFSRLLRAWYRSAGPPADLATYRIVAYCMECRRFLP